MKLTDKQGTVRLSNGVEMPYLGLGAFKSRDGQEVIDTATYALARAYRHTHTAAVYDHEAGVGQATRPYRLARTEVCVTSKVWNSHQGYNNAIKAFKDSMARLGLDCLDLYSLHCPVK